MQGKLTNGPSIYMLDKTLIWIRQTLDKLSSNLNPRINLGSQCYSGEVNKDESIQASTLLRG
jgi:hypothetical protein